jgi:hypothetical protein
MRARALVTGWLPAMMACSAVLLAAGGPPAAQAASTRAATIAANGGAARAPRCGPAQLLTWLGLSGRPGTARGVVVPLEFSNVGRTTCTVSGYPWVQAAGRGGRPVGPPAGRQPRTRPGLVTLRPGQTGHAVLIVAVARRACRIPAKATSLRIRAPGLRSVQQIGLIFWACSQRRTLSAGPVRAGTGIP